jgi:hypothetical protein
MGALIRTGPLTHGGLESRPILTDGLRRRLLQRRQASVELYWLPLGAGDTIPIVSWNGRIFEALVARHNHRTPLDLYHSALVVRLDDDRFVIEMAPAWESSASDRGVVCEGPVGFRCLRGVRLFRYEVRRWEGGVIQDAAVAVESPRLISTDLTRTQLLLNLLLSFPTATWGRDELATGEMWNSNSLIAWLLARSRHETDTIVPPARGRAPGWDAGLVVAKREPVEAIAARTKAPGGRVVSP